MRNERPESVFRVVVGIATAVDTFIILQVKKTKLSTRPESLGMISRELMEYEPLVTKILVDNPSIRELMEELKKIHEQLWDIEARKRILEDGEDESRMTARLLEIQNKPLLVEYLALSRQIAAYNDRRASLKKRINEITGSEIREVKSHNTVK